MTIFLSYAAEDREHADAIQLALIGSGHEVFFDRESLAPAKDFHSAIRAAVERSEIFVFLITPASVTRGSYTLTELKYARTKWPHPEGRVLPVLVREVSLDCIPSYLKAVNILEPEGNITAEVLLAVSQALEGSRIDSFNLGVNLGWLQQGSQFGGRSVSDMAADLERVQATAANARSIGSKAKELIATAQRKLECSQQPGILRDNIDDLIALSLDQRKGVSADALALGIALGHLQQGVAADNLSRSLATTYLESTRNHAARAQYHSYNGFVDNALTKLSSRQPTISISHEVTHLMGLFQGQR